MMLAPRARTKRRAEDRQRLTHAGSLYELILARDALKGALTWPSDRYAHDPAGFFRDILGVNLWSRQVDLINAVRDHDRVAVKAGRKVSKSFTVAGLALWFFCSFPDARVVLTASTAQQVERVLWREIRMLHARAGRCLSCVTAGDGPRPCEHSALISGQPGDLPYTGLKVHEPGDFREIYGFTAKQGEAVQGISGTRLLYVIDEASGIPDFVFAAIVGNMAGGAKMILTGNPTRNAGEFFEAFGPKRLDPSRPGSTGYACVTISSEESPNVSEGREVIRGLATREWVREREQEWGRDSALFQIHVLGEFAINEEGRIFSVASITDAIARWSDTRTDAAARLVVGLDPAGAGGMGDETCFATRRGKKILELLTWRGLTADAHVVHLLGLLGSAASHRETPLVIMDRTGAVGAELYGTLRAHQDEARMRGRVPFDLVGVTASARATRQPAVYDTTRDELAASLADAIKDGLAVPDDTKLAAEMHVMEWKIQANGRAKLTPKDDVRKALGRSPDRFDAVALSCWEHEGAEVVAVPTRPAPVVEQRPAERTFDPYAARNAWGRR